jgi:tripartite motif-containing protein 71
MKRCGVCYLLIVAVVPVFLFYGLHQPIVLAGEVNASAQGSIVVLDEMVLVGYVEDTVRILDDADLIMLGLIAQDLIIEPGGSAVVYGIVRGNVLNQGGELEIYGIVDGYLHTDAGGTTWVDPNAIIVATPPAVTPTPFPTLSPTTVPPTPTALPPTPAPTPAPPVPSAGLIDVSLSLYKAAPAAADREPYERILEYFADAIYEMTNGAHRIGTVTIYDNGAYAEDVDVVWLAREWPRANTTGADKPGWHIYMGDVFPFYSPGYDALDPANWRCSGYVLAHEWGHYFYGVYDEYAGDEATLRASSPQPDDAPVENSVMNNTWIACEEGDLNWLNFSIPKNQTRRNAQYRAYNASAWETVARPNSQDPRNGNRLAAAIRPYYPELAAFAPPGNQDAQIDLAAVDAQAQARSALTIVWAGSAAAADKPAAAVFALASTDTPYRGTVQSLGGATVHYPQPVLLVAQVVKDMPVAKADVRAGVHTPDGAISTLSLRDDGIAPDVLADDGIYSGFMLYTQEGDHTVFVSFNNLAGVAEFTAIGLEHVPGPDNQTDYPGPQPVGENFYAVAHTTVTIGNVKNDDHGNIPADATLLTVNNVDVTGRMDYAADLDMFAVTPTLNSKLVLRLSGFAFDMQPHVQVLRVDGTPVGKAFAFTPEENQYFFTSLRGKANEVFYVAVQHLDPNAVGGIYDISIGPALPNVIESPPLGWLLFVPPFAAAGMLALYFLTRRRPAPRQVAPPRRREYIPPPPRRPQPTETPGESIYKSAAEKPDENDES